MYTQGVYYTVTITGRFVRNDMQILKIEYMTADKVFRSGKDFWEIPVIKKLIKFSTSANGTRVHKLRLTKV